MLSTRRRIIVFSVLIAAYVWSLDKTVVKASDEVTPGHYTVSVMPAFNADMAGRLQKAVDAVDGVSDVRAQTEDSTLHFNVQEGARVKTVQLQQAVGNVSAGAVISQPLLKNTMNTNPGM